MRFHNPFLLIPDWYRSLRKLVFPRIEVYCDNCQLTGEVTKSHAKQQELRAFKIGLRSLVSQNEPPEILDKLRDSYEPKPADWQLFPNPRRGGRGPVWLCPTCIEKIENKHDQQHRWTTKHARLLRELVALVGTDGGFINEAPIRRIGTALYDDGGIDLMRFAYRFVQEQGRYLSEDIWHRIGPWER
ncbi:hypothetical protein [Lamprocystis purpurea]|jgi:hypothetical protein|uniref:hypothetical protein n=1 Tax=Lamprocystis purpurea TaxID=61598 RepID=UPI0012F99368|nr:hypothetical protein [Lamprocystis purpurea]MBV5347824.1 hypothetical protein [bacterium]